MHCRAFGLTLLFALPPALALNVGPDAASPPNVGPDAVHHGALPRVTGPREARASVAIQLSLDELVAAASYVVIATATEQRTQWEELGGSRRIVTYTRLSVDRPVAGQPDGEIWVRTLGGVVGKIGQHVSGDAQLALGAPAMLFLARAGSAVVVSGMSQGHYPVVETTPPASSGPDAGQQPAAKPQGAPRVAIRRLVSSPDAGALLPRRGPAVSARELLVGATLDAAIDAVSRAWQAQHAAK